MWHLPVLTEFYVQANPAQQLIVVLGLLAAHLQDVAELRETIRRQGELLEKLEAYCRENYRLTDDQEIRYIKQLSYRDVVLTSYQEL